MLFHVIEFAILMVFAIAFALPFASSIAALRAWFAGRYLNRYYIFSRKRSGECELHFNPMLGFYYAKPEKYFALREDAIRRFRQRYPTETLFAITYFLQGYYARSGYLGVAVERGRVRRWIDRIPTYLQILCNMASYRKRNEKEWQFTHLFRRVHRSFPLRFTLFGDCRGSFIVCEGRVCKDKADTALPQSNKK